MKHRGLTWDFLQDIVRYSDNTCSHWYGYKRRRKLERVWCLFLQHAPHKGTSSHNSVMFRDLWWSGCEPRYSSVEDNAAACSLSPIRRVWARRLFGGCVYCDKRAERTKDMGQIKQGPVMGLIGDANVCECAWHCNAMTVNSIILNRIK